MKKMALLLVLSLLTFTACSSSSSIESSTILVPASSASTIETGLNGMTESEIKELFAAQIIKADDLYRWLRYYCHEDLDDDLEKIYDVDKESPNGFYWEPVTRFKTKAELYEHVQTFYTEKHTKTVLDWLFATECPSGFSDTGSSYELEYIPSFKEIDGRLYVKSDYIYEEYKQCSYNDLNLLTTILVAERENEVLISVEAEPSGPTYYYILILENNNWVITGDGGMGIPKEWE